MKVLSVDMGGSSIKMACMEQGTIKDMVKIPVRSELGFEAAMPLLGHEISSLLQRHPGIGGIGIAYAGLVDPVRKRILSSNGKYGEAGQIDLEAWISGLTGLPMILENDANAALLGETAYGCAKGETDVVMMILGTGIGTAAMMEGRMVRGKHYQAGCLGGHFLIEKPSEGRLCTCGGRGCLEASAGTWALGRNVRAHDGYTDSGLAGEAKIDFAVLGKWCRQQDPLANAVLDECVDLWAGGIINLIHAYDPETVVLSGGVMHLGEEIILRIRELTDRYAWTPWGHVDIRRAEDPDSSVVKGLNYLMETALLRCSARIDK